jgi:hypothetical protein
MRRSQVRQRLGVPSISSAYWAFDIFDAKVSRDRRLWLLWLALPFAEFPCGRSADHERRTIVSYDHAGSVTAFESWIVHEHRGENSKVRAVQRISGPAPFFSSMILTGEMASPCSRLRHAAIAVWPMLPDRRAAAHWCRAAVDAPARIGMPRTPGPRACSPCGPCLFASPVPVRRPTRHGSPGWIRSRIGHGFRRWGRSPWNQASA